MCLVTFIKAQETFLSFDGTVGTHLHPLVVETAEEENQAFISVFRCVSATKLGHCLAITRQTEKTIFSLVFGLPSSLGVLCQ